MLRFIMLYIRLALVQPFATEQYCSTTTICSDGHRSLTLPCTPYHPDGESRPEVGTDRRRRRPHRPDERPVARPSFSTETLPIPVAVHFIWRDARKTRHLLFLPRKPIRRRHCGAQWRVRYFARQPILYTSYAKIFVLSYSGHQTIDIRPGTR